MTFFHCKCCFRLLSEPGVNFFFTSCGHIFCDICQNHPAPHCPYCKAECKTIVINAGLPENLKALFADPVKEANKLLNALSFRYKCCKMYMEDYTRHIESKYNMYKDYSKKANEEIKKLNLKLQVLMEENERLKRVFTTPVPTTENFQRPPRSYPDGCISQPSYAFQTPRVGTVPLTPRTPLMPKTPVCLQNPVRQRFMMSTNTPASKTPVGSRSSKSWSTHSSLTGGSSKKKKSYFQNPIA